MGWRSIGFLSRWDCLKVGTQVPFPVKGIDDFYYFLLGIHHMDKVQVLGTDIPHFQHAALYPVQKTCPKVPSHQDDGKSMYFMGLDKGDGLKELIHGAKSARQDHKAL